MHSPFRNQDLPGDDDGLQTSSDDNVPSTSGITVGSKRSRDADGVEDEAKFKSPKACLPLFLYLFISIAKCQVDHLHLIKSPPYNRSMIDG